MQIAPTLVTFANKPDTRQLAKKTAPLTSPAGNGLMQAASLITGGFEYYALSHAATGHGTVGTGYQAAAGVSVALGVYSGVQGLRTKITPDLVNAALRDANGGHDLNPADAQELAGKFTKRLHMGAAISLATSFLSAGAILTGAQGLGIGAFAGQIGGLGYTGYATYKTIQETKEVLARQNPQPQGPAPQPQQPPAPAPVAIAV
jgi:hypothetical protein